MMTPAASPNPALRTRALWGLIGTCALWGFSFPVMKALGLLTGTVQAYIFSILATVYIAAAVQESIKKQKKLNRKTQTTN